MSLVELIMTAEAARAHTAVRRTAYRHQHLTNRPLVVVAYNLSGEAAAPLGITYGTDARDAKTVVAAEPRNREARFAAINAFAADFAAFMRPYLVLRTERTSKGSFRQVAHDAPQIVVPNRATRSYLGARLGRSLRYLGLGDTHEVPEPTQWTGSHLSWFAEHSQLPGQSTFLAMTETLSQHFVTGQSALEDESLAALLAWIDGVPGDLLAELERLENSEGARGGPWPYGPVPHPRWEARLEPFVKAYSVGLREQDAARTRLAEEHVSAEVDAALKPAYAATLRALEIMRQIDPAASVAGRWADDVREWSDHARRSTKGIPRFARRHDAIRSARTLQRWSSAQDALETDQAFDDPLIMASLDAEGQCITGVVTSVDDQNREIKPGGKNRTRVPLIELELTGPTRLLTGAVLRWTEDRAVRGIVRAVDSSTATIAIMGGVKAFDTAAWSLGVEVMLVGLDPWEGRDPWGPDEVPWTHRETTSELAGDADAGDGATDGSPDLSVPELADLPVIGEVSPDAEPGVLQ
ncbi:hypothetical protein [Terrabacter sp. 2YAF2]|uniref:hypothetical protein n=1 Tax=Terrabacter sp. 2YAF2 TaxID=3233026 RepID=UPI003F9BB98C